jgi:hypothetical protein
MMALNDSIWLGWDPREASGFAVARSSCRRHLTRPIPIYGLILADLQKAGIYKRPIEYRKCVVDKPIMWDVVSDAPQSTEHANSRFFIPYIAKTGWALFCDGDVIFRSNVARLFEGLDHSKALYCVNHKRIQESGIKMDGQIQQSYPRKNASSIMLFNCDHPANKALTLDVLNNTPGRFLHKFFWLAECDIGELDQSWNYLIGETEPIDNINIGHFTLGLPDMPGYGDCELADEWRDSLSDWARGPLSLGA